MSRCVWLVVVLLLLAGCGGAAGTDADPAPTPATGTPSPAVAADLGGLERRLGARAGVHVLDLASGATVSWRADERFALASTVKALAAGAVLAVADLDLDRRLTWRESDLVTYSPVTETAVAEGLSVAAVVDAALRESDNTAGNLLLRLLDGPAGLERALRALGDRTTSTDRWEPALNEWAPGEDRDTTTPRALARSFAAYAAGDALPAQRRELLLEAMRGSRTGLGLVRAAVPAGWSVAGKSGTASHGTRNDVALVETPEGRRLVVAVMTSHAAADAEPDDDAVAAAARAALPLLPEG